MSTKRPEKPGKPGKANEPENDSVLWHRVAAGVTPLKKRDGSLTAKPKSARPKPEGSPARPVQPVPAAPPPVSPPPLPSLPSLSHGSVAGLDKRSGERLKRGQMPVEARLDLHGMTQDEAHRALAGFITASRAVGKRCVIIITGKGSYRGGVGVLKEAVPRWLNEPSLREHILAFNHAQPRHGGTGALYVLLRRTR